MFLDANVKMALLLNAAVSSTGTSTTGHDVSKYAGALQLLISARASGTNTATVTVEHSDSLSTGYTAVPAEALVNPLTGAEATFPSISTTAYEQSLTLDKEYLKKYVRVTLAGTSLSHNVAIVLAAGKRDSAFT